MHSSFHLEIMVYIFVHAMTLRYFNKAIVQMFECADIILYRVRAMQITQYLNRALTAICSYDARCVFQDHNTRKKSDLKYDNNGDEKIPRSVNVRLQWYLEHAFAAMRDFLLRSERSLHNTQPAKVLFLKVAIAIGEVEFWNGFRKL